MPKAGTPSAGSRTTAYLDLDDFLPYRMSVAANAISNLVAGVYEARFGLTIPQWRLLAVLAQGPAIQRDLVQRTIMDKVTVSRAAQALLARRLVTKTSNIADRRSHLLELAPSGIDLHAEIAPLALAMERSLLEGWSADEVADLKRQCLRLQAAANQIVAVAVDRRGPPKRDA
jgi:DNA-binding MarR family transcriptional regulator